MPPVHLPFCLVSSPSHHRELKHILAFYFADPFYDPARRLIPAFSFVDSFPTRYGRFDGTDVVAYDRVLLAPRAPATLASALYCYPADFDGLYLLQL